MIRFHLPIRRFPVIALPLLLCLGLSGCKETKALQDEAATILTKVEKLKADGAAQESQLLAMRRAMPAGPTPEHGAQKMVVAAQADLTKVDAELTKAVTNYTQAEADLKSMQKELETLRGQARP